MEPNDYSFITSEPTKNSRNILKSSSKTQRILIIIAVIGILLVLILLLFSLLGGDSGDKQSMKLIAQKQTEIIRVSGFESSKIRDQKILNYVISANLSQTSSNNELNALMKKQNVTLDKKELALSKDSKTDQKLASAEQSGKYDETMGELITSLLVDYQKTIKQTNAQSKSYKSYLNESYNQLDVLLKMNPST